MTTFTECGFLRYNKADRRNLRFTLQQLEKNDPQAAPFLVSILRDLAGDNTSAAVATVRKAYGGSGSIGFDFPASEFKKARWQEIITRTVNTDQFKFLDAHPLLEEMPTTY